MAADLVGLRKTRQFLRARATKTCDTLASLLTKPTLLTTDWDKISMKFKDMMSIQADLNLCNAQIQPLVQEDQIQAEFVTWEEYNSRFEDLDLLITQRRRQRTTGASADNPPSSLHDAGPSQPDDTDTEEAADVNDLVDLSGPSGTSTASVRSSRASATSNSIYKLPLLEIKTFKGDFKEWRHFWLQFESAIGENDAITEVDKLQFLLSMLRGPPLELVRGLSLTKTNYKVASNKLIARYGNAEFLKSQHFLEFAKLKPLAEEAKPKTIRLLLGVVSAHITSLIQLKADVEMFAIQIKRLFPMRIVDNCPSRKTTGKKVTVVDILEYISDKVQELEERQAASIASDDDSSSQSDDERPPKVSTASALVANASVTQGNNDKPRPKRFCIFCQINTHWSRDCLAEISLKKKCAILQAQCKCVVCFKLGHIGRECTFPFNDCTRCKGRHFVAMCPTHPHADFGEEEPTTQVKANDNAAITALMSQSDHRNSNAVLMQTIELKIQNGSRSSNVLCLLDSGSQRSFISATVVKQLGLKSQAAERLIIDGFAAKETEGQFPIVELPLTSPYDDRTITISALSIPHITNHVAPLQTIELAKIIENMRLQGLLVADRRLPVYPRSVSLVIGADFLNLVVTGKRATINEDVSAFETIFGWTLQGSVKMTSNNKITCALSTIIDCETIHRDMENLWKFDTIGVKEVNDVASDKTFDDAFSKTTTFDGSNYSVDLPWFSQRKDQLATNRELALSRFKSTMRRITADENLFNQYDQAMAAYIEEGHAEQVNENDEVGNNPVYYLPHHPIVNENRSTKVRIVFDASSHAPGELSLNDCLFGGSNRSIDLLKILLKFRSGRYACTSDMRKAFLQIKINPPDRHVLRFFWINRNLPPAQWARQPVLYCMNRVIFGMKCSSYLLKRTIIEHCANWGKLPNVNVRAINTLLASLYVDDIVFSDDYSHIITDMLGEISQSLHYAGFQLHKIIRNDDICNIASTSVLGLRWSTITDELSVHIPTQAILGCNQPTKRQVVQLAASIFDPMGMLAPLTIRPKIIMQETWRRRIKWDETLPDDLLKEWRTWQLELNDNVDWTIPRHITTGRSPATSGCNDLHVFADASPKAFGYIAYQVYKDDENHIRATFVMAKARVAPIKKELSLPQMELLAAAVASRAVNYININRDTPSNVYMWSDSQISLDWISHPSKKVGTFVSNRVAEIRKLTQSAIWSHCPGNVNPADIASKPCTNLKKLMTEKWWTGPSWLTLDNSQWPQLGLPIPTSTSLIIAQKQPDTYDSIIDTKRFSNFNKATRVAAKVLQAINLMRKQPEVATLEQAELLLIKESQKRWFQADLSALQNQRDNVTGKSKLRRLLPFIDEDGILRAQGRLQRAVMSYDEQHPILMHPKDPTTQLYIQFIHERLRHAGSSTTLATLRQRMWVLAGRRACNQVIHKCVTCERFYRKPIVQPEAPLPFDRTNLIRPFQCTGLDFAGPLFTRDPIKTTVSKAYIAVFTCTASRAVHLELVSRMTTEAFLMALQRFIGRRGTPNTIYSDNAKQFKRAAKDLHNLNLITLDSATQNFSQNKRIQWKFIVERAPWWGGFWERMIRTIKEPLKRTLKSNILAFEDLQTVLIEVEAAVNSRPIAALHTDLDDIQPLTPAHLLLGGPLIKLSHRTESSTINVDVLDAFKARKQLMTNLINKWRELYLLQLQTTIMSPERRVKELRPGQVVLLTEPPNPPHLWQLARIQQTFLGRDGIVRSCSIKTAEGKELRRPVNLLVSLETVNGYEPP